MTTASPAGSGPNIPGVAHRFITVNGIRLHLAEAGAGTPVLLLHGFPEFWWSWRHQIPSLMRHGRLLMPDLRGYNDSDKPPGDYDLPTLARDMAALIMAECNGRPVLVVGHDWGGIIAYQLAMDRPDLVSRLVILNAPHPHAWARALIEDPAQRAKGWYVFLTLVPGEISETLYRQQFADGSIRLARAMAAKEVRMYAAAFEKPGAASATVGYYRAFARTLARTANREPPPIDCPVTVLWGMRDEALEPIVNDIAAAWIPDLRIVPFPNNWHWLACEQPDVVTRHILRALKT